MKNNFLAKSSGETILRHTENLFNNFMKIFMVYPKLNVEKKLLLLACIYHDLGKINQKFQSKLSGEKQSGEIPHGILSTSFINDDILIEYHHFSEDEIKILAHSVALHHERNLMEINDSDLSDEIYSMNNEVKNFSKELKILENIYFEYFKNTENYKDRKAIFNWEDGKVELAQLSSLFYEIGSRVYSDVEGSETFQKYVMLKGLLNKIDYAASSYIPVEEKNDFLEEKMNAFLKNILKRDNPENDWNELQKFMIHNQNKNVVVVAQTGYGKTEAGLLWIGNNKGFFTLPLRVAINAIFDRVKNQIVIEKLENRIGLLHSDFREIYIEDIKKKEKNNPEKMDNDELFIYMDKTKQLSLPLTVCTIDQLFDFVFRAPGFELKVATLSYSKVVIDEIQMYSTDLLAYLIYGLKYITDFGGKFAIMTATLPGIITDLLKKEEIEFETREPFINDKKRHNLKILKEVINAKFIKENYKDNKILVVCNTVKKSKQIYEDLKKLGIECKELNLLHSRFIKKDRAKKEKEISEFANPKRFKENVKKERELKNICENGIWIGTQVVEASLDLDFDILVTELSDLNGLFQRMGRCYRNREILDEKYNCYVFTEECSGIKSSKAVIDKEIHQKSKEALIDIDGLLTEKEKLELIDEVYSTENLKDTEYYGKLVKNIYALKNYIVEYEKTKSEVQKIFRNIASKDIIPKIIYQQNEKEIKKNIEILQKKAKGLNEKERKNLRSEKIEARREINQFKVAIPEYEFDDISPEQVEKMEINDYETLIILDCDYSYEKGFEVKMKNQDFFEDNTF
ncbi:CRISPR-associated helicase Cas3' [Leptotrichia sp. oral taxon 223]|uniref:CRISPR-associated helicase Cas3' n=1 Tax=Leptotrichia sp. oral taxon 223 TaxID=712363 RepID=UPI0015B977C9|nr:CRISPR-associated helicase Cas3' [Leptotrichia sp. oral taxon 223]NWO20116.1 CRISPR-associated helicase Cas3' [Leptotrichia sp. oral taxon 223]